MGVLWAATFCDAMVPIFGFHIPLLVKRRSSIPVRSINKVWREYLKVSYVIAISCLLSISTRLVVSQVKCRILVSCCLISFIASHRIASHRIAPRLFPFALIIHHTRQNSSQTLCFRLVPFPYTSSDRAVSSR